MGGAGAKARLLLVAAAVGAVAAAVLLGGLFRDSSHAASPQVIAEANALQDDFTAADTATLVSELQASLRARPDDAHANALLGLAYQQRARETGDPSYYPRSAGVLRRALAIDPKDALATSGLGSLALSRHRFRDALALGLRARAFSPATARNYGVIGDALVELGRYRQAFAAFDRMAHLRPGLAAYARISYARELRGDWRGAVAAMQLALGAAIGQREALAWTHVQLGKLYWARGRLDAAERQYRAALAGFPGYVYARDALAQVEAARGRPERAMALEREASATIPLPQFVGLLGDLYRTTGDERLARRQYALVAVIERLLRANGVRTDLETALFDVDHGIRPRHALELARAAQADRPSIDGDDVLAWALARNGRCGEALRFSKRALRLGTRDALKMFHRGMIERCLGHRADARLWLGRALALNPHFSVLWAPVARSALS
ncbi:MAG TPA: tetratricopeptide repeat protein [Gaiellaceae bacterium]